MEYKIRANNQKEAVEVYKAIRQIQQGNHNIAVNADSRKDAVRIYKEAKRVCDSKKVKDEDYKLMRAIIDICKKYNYYTYGTLEDYNKLLNNADKMDLVDIATNISVHSDENDSRKIEQILKKELASRGIVVKDSKLKDKQNLVRGDWFVRINDLVVGSYLNIPLYKVLDMQTHDDGMIYVDVYHIKSDIKQNKTMLVHGGTSWFKLSNSDRYGVGLSGLTIFSSADEALKWAKQIVATRNAKR